MFLCFTNNVESQRAGVATAQGVTGRAGHLHLAGAHGVGHVDVALSQGDLGALLCEREVMEVMLRWLARPGDAPGEVVRGREARHSAQDWGGVCLVVNKPIRGQADIRALVELWEGNIRLTG